MSETKLPSLRWAKGAHILMTRWLLSVRDMSPSESRVVREVVDSVGRRFGVHLHEPEVDVVLDDALAAVELARELLDFATEELDALESVDVALGAVDDALTELRAQGVAL